MVLFVLAAFAVGGLARRRLARANGPATAGVVRGARPSPSPAARPSTRPRYRLRASPPPGTSAGPVAGRKRRPRPRRPRAAPPRPIGGDTPSSDVAPPTFLSPASLHRPESALEPLSSAVSPHGQPHENVLERRPRAGHARHRRGPGPRARRHLRPRPLGRDQDARAKLGPVHLYDPGHSSTPPPVCAGPRHRMRVTDGATARAAALLAPVRPARPRPPWRTRPSTLLRCWLHAAAVDGRPFRQVHRWATGASGRQAARRPSRYASCARSQGRLRRRRRAGNRPAHAHPERREAARASSPTPSPPSPRSTSGTPAHPHEPIRSRWNHSSPKGERFT